MSCMKKEMFREACVMVVDEYAVISSSDVIKVSLFVCLAVCARIVDIGYVPAVAHNVLICFSAFLPAVSSQ